MSPTPIPSVDVASLEQLSNRAKRAGEQVLLPPAIVDAVVSELKTRRGMTANRARAWSERARTGVRIGQKKGRRVSGAGE